MADLFERILLLKKSPIFSEVATEDLRSVALELEDEQYFKGDKVFEINNYGDFMYILQNGKIGISLESDPDANKYLATLTAGDCFGEMNLLDDQPRSATAVALEDSHLLSLEKSRLHGLIIHYPELSLGIMKSMSLRLRNANLLAKAGN
ncbi:MAG: cyclic nucleotide-binding domain-containing protein [Gammaproteobacteria bacterium]|nr:cyclic nucleotide-binding domain-containing protein [Gammaproteobacteria bacterium]